MRNSGASITTSEKRKFVKATGTFKTYTYYHCTRRVGIDDCREPPVTLSNLESQIENLLRQYSISSTFLELGMEILENSKGQEKEQQQAIKKKKQNAVLELQAKLDKLMNYLLNETISEDDYKTQKQQLEKQLAFEQTRLKESEAHAMGYNQLIQNAFQFCNVALSALKTGDVQTCRFRLEPTAKAEKPLC